MISGYLLLDRKYSISEILRRIMYRLGIPLLVWSVFYVIWNHRVNFFAITPQSVLRLIADGSIFHLYYLIILIGLYANLPWLSNWLNEAGKKEKQYGFILAWIIGFGMYLSYYLNLTTSSVMSLFTWWLPYLGYFMTGYHVRNATWSKKQIIHLGCLFITWWIFTIIMGYAQVQMIKWNLNILWNSSGISYFDTFLSPNNIIMSISAFILIIKGVNWQIIHLGRISKKLIQWISSISFGMYLVHPAIIDWIDLKFGLAIEFVKNSLTDFMFYRSFFVILCSIGVATLYG